MKRTRAPRTPIAAAPSQTETPPTQTPVEPVDKRVKVTCWIRESVAKAMKHECVDRNLNFGELVEEAMQARLVKVFTR